MRYRRLYMYMLECCQTERDTERQRDRKIQIQAHTQAQAL